LAHAGYRTHDGVVGLRLSEPAPPQPKPAAVTHNKNNKAAAKGEGEGEGTAARPLQLSAGMLAGDQASLRTLLSELRQIARAVAARAAPEGVAAAPAPAAEGDDDELALEDNFVVRLGDMRWFYQVAGTHASDDANDSDNKDDKEGGGTAAAAARKAKGGEKQPGAGAAEARVAG
jgi:hypothetical protein